MKTRPVLFLRFLSLFLTAALPASLPAANAQLLGWNNLGMHCMDSDYSVFSILPPYNTVEAQLLVNGRLVTNGTGYTVTYQAVADPDGSINSTAVGKGNFNLFDLALYGADLAPDAGLRDWPMPGTNNTPQGMLFERTNTPAPGAATLVNWFRAEGIPITPYDDAGKRNPYPLMRLIARNGGGAAIATNDVVLPVSDEMDCRVCHASGTQTSARPAAGWVWSSAPERDYRLNILRLHDEQEFAQNGTLYHAALAARGFNPLGLYQGVVADGKPVLCAACHASEALGAPSYGTIPALTASVHAKHAAVTDPELHITLNNAANRAACYRCHPGSTTKCLRGAMGGAVAADGSLEMQCQSCHGSMSQVGSTNRVGWFMEPNCQSCHSGTATSNSGQIRYPSVFTDANGTVRVPANTTFATTPNTPATGLSLYRFSSGHGGLQCSACHGSTHAEFPATHRNDNLRNERIQGHAGVMIECTACHVTSPNTTIGGPHGMHPLGQTWISGHKDAAENGGSAQCQPCHGSDLRGTVLSRMQAARTLNAFGSKTWWRGFQVGCYSCHNGPSDEDENSNAPAVVGTVTTNVTCGATVAFTLPGTDANGNPLTFRIVSQPAHGSVGLNNRAATYFAEPGFVGTDKFTFAAWDGSVDSNLGTGTVAVAQGPFSVTASAQLPVDYPANWPVPFGVMATVSNLNATATHDWDFGDGSPHGSQAHLTHAYSAAGSYNWKVVSAVQGPASSSATTNSGTIAISAPAKVMASVSANALLLIWPRTGANVIVEESSSLGPDAVWTPSSVVPVVGPDGMSVTIPSLPTGAKFYRLRQL